MRNLILLFSALILGTSGALADTTEDKVAIRNAYSYNDSFIFVENGITFSVYPDGEFDFYIDERVGVSANVNIGRTNITFNSGYDYNPFVQYDDYGAVIQVENIPIYYDYYGRVSQIGDVDIRYNNGRVSRLGGLYVYYDNRGYYSHYRGYINTYNRNYVYRPFHSYFARPAVGFCLVYNRPYRRYYTPVRYTYYSPYRYNTRRTYASVGKEYRYNNRNDRSSVYRNDKRVVAVRDNVSRSNRTTQRSSGDSRTTVNRSASNSKREPTGTYASRTTERASNSTSRTATQREARTSTTPRATTATRSATTYRKPANNSNVSSNQRAATSTSSRSTGVTNRSASPTRTAKSTPSREKSVSTRSTTSSRAVSTPSKSSRVSSASNRSSSRRN